MLTRRGFLETSSLTAAAAFLSGAWRSILAGDDRLRALRGGTGIFTEKGGTIGWFVGESGAVVIDTQSVDSAPHCLAGLRAKTARKLDAVLITHHHADHTGGIGVFKPEAARVVAHRSVPGLQKEAATRRGNLDAQVYPEVVFDATWRLELGSETVAGRYVGPAHTGGDAVYHFEKAGVVHVGDLVFHKMVPFIDRPGGASIEGWIRALGQVEKAHPKETIFVYGHASAGNDVVGGPEGLSRTGEYLSGLLDYVRKGKAAGKTVDELSKVQRIPGFEDVVPMGDTAIPNNVQAAWDEIG